ncbi:MAG: MDR family MFS transporter [Ktedonobacterales bacterium]
MARTNTANDVTLPAQPVTAASLGRAKLYLVILGLMLGMLLAALDQTIVGTALPRIVTALGGTNITWVITSYLLASTVSIPIIGKLSDIYGRRIFFLGGMVTFLAGSALSGTSQNMGQLVIYRGIQGLGAGALMPIALAVIGDLFEPAERAKWQGLFIAVFGLSAIVGPLIGGAITDNWGWRWVFYVNMPVGLVGLIAAGLFLPASVRRVMHKIDYLGTGLLVIWATSLLLAFSLGGTNFAWNSWQIISLFAVAAVGVVVFVYVEFHQPEPILNPKLFETDIFAISVVAMFILGAGMFGAISYLTYFAQIGLEESATNTGVILTPMMLGFIVSSIVGGQLMARTGRYKILVLVGFAVGAFGMFLLSRMTTSTTNGTLVLNMIVTGLGIGVLMSLFTIIVQNAFSNDLLGQVTSGITFFRTLGASIGVAVLGAIVTNVYTSKLAASVPAPLKPYVNVTALANLSPNNHAINVPAALAHLGPETAAALLKQLEVNVKASFVSSITLSFTIGMFMMIAAGLVALFLKEIPLQKRQPVEVPAGANGEAAEVAPPTLPEPVF